MANGSRTYVGKMRSVLWMVITAVGAFFKHAAGEYRHAIDRGFSRVAVRHHARQIDHVGNPAAIFLALNFDAVHRIGRLVSKASSFHYRHF